MTSDDEELGPTCPACGGAGGGPFGHAGSAWDTEEYVCARCNGLGVLRGEPAAEVRTASAPRPGLVKTTPPVRVAHVAPVAPEKKRRTSRG